MKFVFSELFPLIWQKITNRYKSIFINIYYLYLFICVLRINLLYWSFHVTVINSLRRSSILFYLWIISNACAAAYSSNFQGSSFSALQDVCTYIETIHRNMLLVFNSIHVYEFYVILSSLDKKLISILNRTKTNVSCTKIKCDYFFSFFVC